MLKQLVTDEKIGNWHRKYVKPYRDALAHRIPLYVPPLQLTEEEAQRTNAIGEQIMAALKRYDFEEVERLEAEEKQIGAALPVFVHSHSPKEGSPAMLLHPQLIVDAKTLLEILNAAFPDAEKGGVRR